MKRPRLRNWAKWVCMAAVIALVALAVASVWFRASWISAKRTTSISLGWGLVIVDVWPQPIETDHTGLTLVVSDEAKYYFAYTHLATRPGRYQSWHLPLWPLVVAAAIPALVLQLVDRRFRAHQCKKCGYDRRGLRADTKCPECGTAVGPG